MWNPPITDEETGARGARALAEAADLLVGLVIEGARTIVFMKSRKAVELMAHFAELELQAARAPASWPSGSRRTGPATRPRSGASWSGGWSTASCSASCRTDALELGIDIGALDAAICVTFPGTVASLRQMWGRAGRRGRGLAIYVAGEDALDQFFCRHPDEFLERPVEAAILDHENEQLYAAHLLCAAHEGPLEAADAARARAALARVRGRAGRAAATCASGPTARSSRAAPTSTRRARVAAQRRARRGGGHRRRDRRGDRRRRRRPGALDGAPGRGLPARRAQVRGLGAAARRPARVRAPFDGDWYTQPKRETDTHIEQVLASRTALGVQLELRHRRGHRAGARLPAPAPADHEAIDLIPLDLPQTSFAHAGALVRARPSDDLGTLHAAEHSQIAVLPLLAMCDRWDIGGLSTNYHPQTGGPTIFIYDGHPGGIGIARRGYEAFERLVGDAYRLVSECPCESGCPSCVQSPKCGNLNEPLSQGGLRRADAAAMLRVVYCGGPGLQLGQRVDRRRRLGRPPAVDPDLEVQVRAVGAAGVADVRDPLTRGDRGALGHDDRAGLQVHEDVVAAVGAGDHDVVARALGLVGDRGRRSRRSASRPACPRRRRCPGPGACGRCGPTPNFEPSPPNVNGPWTGKIFEPVAVSAAGGAARGRPSARP